MTHTEHLAEILPQCIVASINVSFLASLPALGEMFTEEKVFSWYSGAYL